MNAVPPISHCIGDYDVGDTICDGDGGVDPPCSWRRRCIAFRRHLRTSGEDIEQYVSPKAVVTDGEEAIIAYPVDGPEEFAEFCDQLIEDRLRSKAHTSKRRKKIHKKRKQTKDRQYDKRRDGPAAVTKQAAKKALRRRARERQRMLMAMFDGFKAELVSSLDGREFAVHGQVVAPGQLFVVDRINTSRYVSLYCQTAQGWNEPLVLLQFRTASLTFDVCLPVGVELLKEHLSKAAFKKLSPTPIEDGRFKSEVSKAGKVELALVAESIAYLVNGGIIVLPVK